MGQCDENVKSGCFSASAFVSQIDHPRLDMWAEAKNVVQSNDGSYPSLIQQKKSAAYVLILQLHKGDTADMYISWYQQLYDMMIWCM